MTREEAIKELKEDIELYIPLRGTIDDVDRDLPDGRLITALEMGIKALEQEPKTGHWIDEIDDYGKVIWWHCDKCYEDSGFTTDCKWKYCPNCGAKMVEPQETETWNGYHGQITAPKVTFERIFNEADDDSDI